MIKTDSFKQLHGIISDSETTGSKLYINLDICNSDKCAECVVDCSYFYHQQDWIKKTNNGVIALIELATFNLVCRKCEEPHCVNICPWDALEKLEDPEGMLVRHTVRCVSCRSCSHSCPYGTIFPEILPHLTNICDFCEGRGEPSCIPSCPYGAIRILDDSQETEENTFRIGNNLVVHSTHWNKDKA